MSRCAGGQDVVDQQHVKPIQIAPTPDAERTAEIRSAADTWQARLVGRTTCLAEYMPAQRDTQAAAKSARQRFSLVVNHSDSLGPVLRHRDDQVDAQATQLRTATLEQPLAQSPNQRPASRRLALDARRSQRPRVQSQSLHSLVRKTTATTVHATTQTIRQYMRPRRLTAPPTPIPSDSTQLDSTHLAQTAPAIRSAQRTMTRIQHVQQPRSSLQQPHQSTLPTTRPITSHREPSVRPSCLPNPFAF